MKLKAKDVQITIQDDMDFDNQLERLKITLQNIKGRKIQISYIPNEYTYSKSMEKIDIITACDRRIVINLLKAQKFYITNDFNQSIKEKKHYVVWINQIVKKGFCIKSEEKLTKEEVEEYLQKIYKCKPEFVIDNDNIQLESIEEWKDEENQEKFGKNGFIDFDIGKKVSMFIQDD